MNSYINRIIEGQPPQKEIIDFFFERLENEASAGFNDSVNYTTNSKIIQIGVMKKIGKTYSRNVVGATLCAFLNFSGLEKEKEYVVKRGDGKAIYQLSIKKGKIKQLKERFGYV